MNRAELKAQAKANLKRQTGTMILIVFLVIIINGVLAATGLGSIVSLIISGPLSVGLWYVFERNACGVDVDISDVFVSFKTNFGEAFLLNLLISIFVFLWSLLLIVPGIIKSLSYSMANYILMRNPELTSAEALNSSKDLMEGHKMDLFLLNLSFIPWILLVLATCGIAGLWVAPYMQATQTLFYKDLYEKNITVEN